MSKTDKLILKVLTGNADNNFPMDELKRLLFILGFLKERVQEAIPYTKKKELQTS
jgi:hypothetical protein